MIALVRVELLKLRTVRFAAMLALSAAVLVALMTLLLVAVSQQATEADLDAITTVADLRSVVEVAAITSLFTVVLGATAFPGETRHRTITPTFLATPRRWRIVAAKLVANALVGALIGLVTGVVALLVAAGVLAAGGDVVPFGASVVEVILLGALATGLAAAFGVGIGAAIPSQLGSVLVALGWMMVVEQLLSGLVPDVAPWLPFSSALVAVTASDPDPSRIAGLLLFVTYGAVVTVIGAWLVERRDVS